MSFRTPTLVLIASVAACNGNPPGVTDHSFSIIAVTPAADATDVALDTSITLELDREPAADFAVELVDAAGTSVTHSTVIAGTRITLVPSDPLWISSDYTIAVDPSARSADGLSLGTPYTSRFITRDGTWAAVPIYTGAAFSAADPLGSGAAPSLAVTQDGTVLAMWEAGGEVRDQRYQLGAGWATTAGSFDVIGDPDMVAVAAAGSRAVAAFELYGTRADIVARVYNDTWSAPVTVAPHTDGSTFFDQYLGGVAATDTSDCLTFHRGDFDLDHFNLYASINTGGSWSAPIALEQLAGSAVGSQITADGHGGYVVGWIQTSEDGAGDAVWMTTVSASGTAGTPMMLDSGPGRAYSLTVAHSGDRVQLAWGHAGDQLAFRVVTQAVTSAGLGPRHEIDLAGFDPYGEWIRVAASTRGTLLVWSHYESVNAQLESGGVWSSSTQLTATSSDPLDDVGRPAIALDERGNASVVWTILPHQGRHVTMASRATAGHWSAATPLESGTANTYAWTSGVDAAGRVTALWSSTGSSGYTIWGARLE